MKIFFANNLSFIHLLAVCSLSGHSAAVLARDNSVSRFSKGKQGNHLVPVFRQS